jgi:hypothetical protein
VSVPGVSVTEPPAELAVAEDPVTPERRMPWPIIRGVLVQDDIGEPSTWPGSDLIEEPSMFFHAAAEPGDDCRVSESCGIEE